MTMRRDKQFQFALVCRLCSKRTNYRMRFKIVLNGVYIMVIMPTLLLAGGATSGSAGLNKPGRLDIAYSNLISGAADITAGIGLKTLVIGSSAITEASTICIGVSETAAEVAHNLNTLKKISQYCIVNNISVMVEANLTFPPTWADGAGKGHNQLVDQWAPVAASVGLPISAVEDVQELPTTQLPNTYASIAATEANAVKTLIADYAGSTFKLTAENLAVGDMEGGPPDMAWLTKYWDAYDAAATAIGVPKFSFTTADTGWFGPWIGTLSRPSWQGYLTTLSQLTASHGMALNVVVQGTQTAASAGQFLQQAIQNAADLARLQASGSVNVSSIEVISWNQLPVGIGMISSPTSGTNEAAEIRAIYQLYAAGSITALGATTFASPGQVLLNVGTAKFVVPVSIQWNATDVRAGNQLAVVLIDQTGALSATRHGSGFVTNVASNILVLVGNSIDLAAELNSVMLAEANAGSDTINVAIYGSTGNLSSSQIYVFAGARGQSVGSIASTNSLQGWSSSSAILSSGTSITSGSVMTTETLLWNTTANPADQVILGGPPGQSSFLNVIAIHEPLAEYGVQYASGALLGTKTGAVANIFDPTVDIGAFPTNGYANNPGINNVSFAPLPGWLPNAFDAAQALRPMIVQSTTNSFNSISGKLEVSRAVLAPDPIIVVDKTGTHSNSFATAFDNGGSQVTVYNTGGNPAWQQAWGNQFSSVTSTYDSSGDLVEQFFQGGPSNPLFTIDYVFNPNNGQLWEVFQSTSPPPKSLGGPTYATTGNPYQAGFATGPLYITQFNTGNNPNWDYLDWGSTISSDTEVWVDNFILENFADFVVNFPGQYSGGLNVYPYEFVNGSIFNLMYLPGTISVDLNALGHIVLNSRSLISGLSGLTQVNAAGATGNVTLIGCKAGGSTLVGGDFVSTIRGFGHDTIVAGAGHTSINTGSGGSVILLSGSGGIVSEIGGGNTITAVAGTTLVLNGVGNTVNGSGITISMATKSSSVNANSGGNTFYLTAATVGSSICCGGTSNILHIQGGGSITMGNAILGVQTVYLDDGTSGSTLVANSTNGLVIHAGMKTDIITVNNQSQVVYGSSGSLLVKATAQNAGVAIVSGSGSATLEITTGGTVKLNSSNTNFTVKLDATTNLNLGPMSFITAIGSASGHNVIIAGGLNQTLKGIGGHDTLVGSLSFGDVFSGTASGLSDDTIKNFGGSDKINITDISFAGLKLALVDPKLGSLRVSDTSHQLTLTMGSGYNLSNFTSASDGHGGTLIGFLKH